MRKVIFVANGKEFKTLSEAKRESNYVDVKLAEYYINNNKEKRMFRRKKS